MSRIYFVAALVTILIGISSVPASAQSGRTFYIDYASGSNANNGTSKSTPWKTHPYMQTSSACTGSGTAPAYTHAAGDQFIFKAGVTWPAACFQMTLQSGGTSSAQDYYGVDQTWYSGASFTRPKFDMAQAVPSAESSGYHHNVIFAASYQAVNYVTIDNIEIANQGISGTNNYGTTQAINPNAGTQWIIKNMYIHDWVMNANTQNSPWPEYSAGGVIGNGGATRLINSTISDANGFAFINGVRTSGGFSGACENCYEVSGSTFHDVGAACFGVPLCHDSEFYHVYQNSIETAATAHTQVIEDENGVGGFTVFNNLIHDTYAGIVIFVGYANSQVYNNVLWNNSNNNSIELVPVPSDSSGNRGYVYNNTVDCTSSGVPCIGLQTYSGISNIQGTLFIQNNIAIPAAGVTAIQLRSSGTVNQSNNDTMSASEANQYGFTSANKYKGGSSDSNVTGSGVNLSSLCGGGMSSLCSDAQGAPWFGGSYAARSTSWDEGAYVLGAQSSSQPNPPTNLTATVQ